MNFRERNPLLLGVVAVCAMGIGITGTMLWMQERTPQAVKTTSTPTPSALPEAAPVLPSTTELSNAQTALNLGNQFYDAGQWPRAIAQYRMVITGGFDNPDVRTDLGNALRFNGQPQQALEQYKIAQRQDPSHEQSLFNQGGLWAFSLRNPTKGVEAWRAYLKRFPNGRSAKDARAFIAKNLRK
ncbi:hypothetical protein IAD21_05668 [Abditibacteriota bacterium]|nr:hypothetical protein IAD21_05668 [Abditibacteriota bacterium]